MTPDDPAFIRLAKKVDDIHLAMVGDELKGIKGVVSWNNKMKEDLYGVDANGEEMESKKNTVLIRLSDLEDSRKQIKWFIVAIVTIVSAVKFGIGTLWEKMWSK
jgi:hypothetical protein